MTTELQCPRCKKTVLWSDKFPHRPFCSERCQLIDLGGWAQERYSIPVLSETDEEEWE